MRGMLLSCLCISFVLACTIITPNVSGEELPEYTVEPTPTEYTPIEDAIETHQLTVTSTVFVAEYVQELSGSVDETGGVHIGQLYPGDNKADHADFESFITFDIAGLPFYANITSMIMAFSECTENGLPFSDLPIGLGVLYIEVLFYEELDVSDYSTSNDYLVAEMTLCDMNGVDVTAAEDYMERENFLQFRLYFLGSNLDDYRDDVVLQQPELTIIYTD
ncbi:MAG: hypothetical protein ACXABY_11650 [Candidatus Thorarchaeota archaeon]